MKYRLVYENGVTEETDTLSDSQVDAIINDRAKAYKRVPEEENIGGSKRLGLLTRLILWFERFI